jgi:hypothetical protein
VLASKDSRCKWDGIHVRGPSDGDKPKAFPPRLVAWDKMSVEMGSNMHNGLIPVRLKVGAHPCMQISSAVLVKLSSLWNVSVQNDCLFKSDHQS